MKTNKREGIKLLTLLIVFSLLIILTGKFFFGVTYSNNLLFLYGVSVTLVILIVFFVAFYSYEDPYLLYKNKRRGKKNDLVSCLVAVKDEEGLIGSCVESLINQDYKNKEIIIVNDGSTDKTKEILEDYSRKKLIKLINLKNNVGKKKALAKAILVSQGKIIAFSDSDSIVSKDAISKIMIIFDNDPMVGAVSGHVRASNGDTNLLTKIQDAWYEGQFSIRKAFESVFGAVTCISGPLAVFRREAIFNFIPAWENDKFLGREFKFATDRTLTGFVLGSKHIEKKIKRTYADSPFVKDINYEARNWKTVYCKSARAFTKVPEKFSGFAKQQIRWKKSFIRNTFFTGSFYWRKNIIASLIYYFHILFVVVGPLIAFRHLIYFPIKHNYFSIVYYLAGISFIGFMFALAYRLEDKKSNRWVYRPLMNLLSTIFLSWLIFYSALTIRKTKWVRS